LQRHLQLGLVLGVIKIHLLFVDIDLLLWVHYILINIKNLFLW
jgi:hypothetical protein